MLEFDTKGVCFLCLNEGRSVSNGKETEDQKPDLSGTAIRMLIRYLKVDVTKFSSAQSLNAKMSVSLCENCYKVATDFLELFQIFDTARILMDKNVRKLFQFMEKVDVDRVEEYEKRLKTGNLEDLIKAETVEKLRLEIMAKASRQIDSSWPKVSIKKIDDKKRTVTVNQDSSAGPGTLQNEGVNREEQLQPDGNDEYSDANTGNSSASSSVAGQAESVGPDAGDSINEASRKIDSSWPKVFLKKIDDKKRTVTVNQDSSAGPGTLQNEGVNREEQLQLEGNDELAGDNAGISSGSSSVAGQAESVNLNTGDSKGSAENLVQATTSRCKLKPTKRQRCETDGAQLENEHSDENCNLKTGTCLQTTPKGHKCAYCSGIFAQPTALRNHQLRKHAKKYLSDKGLLPPNISNTQLDKAVTSTIRKNSKNSTSDQHHCPICNKGGLHLKYMLRLHLLKKHLVDVTATLGKIRHKKNQFTRKKWTPFRCAPCKRFFATRQTLQFHRLRVHVAVTNHQGLLGSGISEEQLDKVLKEVEIIVGQMKSAVTQCPFCAEPNHFSRKCTLRTHLLGEHAHQIVTSIQARSPQVQNLSISVNASHPRPDEVRSKNQVPRSRSIKSKKCEICGRYFIRKWNVVAHKLSVHPMTWLKGHVPESVTEEMVMHVIKKITKRARIQLVTRKSVPSTYHRVFYCPLCKKKVWNTMKTHLLRCHLDHVTKSIMENLELDGC